VVLDMTMPRLNGEGAFRELRAMAPRLPVVLSSGYNEQESVSAFLGRGLDGFVQKPYRAAALVRKVEEAIEAAEAAP
jgi:CheY-like chemotaxis protein